MNGAGHVGSSRPAHDVRGPPPNSRIGCVNATLVRGSKVRHCSRKFPGFTQHTSRIRHPGVFLRQPGRGHRPIPWYLSSTRRRPRRPARSRPVPVAARRSPGHVDYGRVPGPSDRPSHGLPTRLADRAQPGNGSATAPRSARIAGPGHRPDVVPPSSGSVRVQVSGVRSGLATGPVPRRERIRAAGRDRAGSVPWPRARPAGPARGNGSAPSTAPPDRSADTPGSVGRRHCARTRHTTQCRVRDSRHIRTERPDPAGSA